jgi:AcrR family transcriptional regulator
MTRSHSRAGALVDGRRARSQRTRQAMIEAVIALVKAAEAPTARLVAERAGVAERTLFSHFVDLEQLYAEASREHLRRTLAEHEPVDPELAVGERVERLAVQRAAVLEAMTPLRRAFVGREAASPELRRSRAAWTEISRSELQAWFPERLAGVAGTEQAELLDVAVAVGSLAFWDELRLGLGLDVDGARRVLTRALRELLAPDR